MSDIPAPEPALPAAAPASVYAKQAALRKLDSVDQLFLLQTRNAVMFIAWVIGILLILAAVVGIITAVQLIHLVHAVTGGGGSGYGGGGY